MPQNYHLASHIHACCTGRYYIFLDLYRDRYFSIPKSAFLPLTTRIHGWEIPKTSLPGARDVLTPETSELAAFLLRQNVLRTHPEEAKTATCPSLAPPDADAPSILDSDLHIQPRHIAPLHVLHCLSYAHLQLKFCPLRRILSSISRRKAAHKRETSDALSTVLSLTASFAKYRPYFPRSFLCLLDSLALIHFLAAYGTYPEWVFGVREDPFYAHCWLQFGTLILNDFHDRIATYTPIMVI